MFRKQVDEPNTRRKFAGIAISQENAKNNVVLTPVHHQTNDTPKIIEQKTPTILLPLLDVLGQQSKKPLVVVATTTKASQPHIIPNLPLPTLTTPEKPIIPPPIISSEAYISPTIIGIRGTNESPTENVETPTTVAKERKRRMRIDDDDESPTFNPMSRGIRRGRGRGGRGNRGRGRLRTPNQQPRSASNSIISSPDKSRDGGSSSCVFTTPDGKADRRKLVLKESTTTLQVFEEDTRMSANDAFTTPMR